MNPIFGKRCPHSPLPAPAGVESSLGVSSSSLIETVALAGDVPAGFVPHLYLSMCLSFMGRDLATPSVSKSRINFFWVSDASGL